MQQASIRWCQAQARGVLFGAPCRRASLASWRAPLNDVGDTAKRLAIVSLT